MSNIVILMVTLQLFSGTGQTRLIRSSTLFEVSVKCFPIISCLKCMVNSYFHLFRRKSLPTDYFEISRSERIPHAGSYWLFVMVFSPFKLKVPYVSHPSVPNDIAPSNL